MILPITLSERPASITHANPDVLWGWKRDTGPRQRVIAFGGVIDIRGNQTVCLNDWFFFFRTRAEMPAIAAIYSLLQNRSVSQQIGTPRVWKCNRTGWTTLERSGGPAISGRMPLIMRLLRRRPRPRVPLGLFPCPTTAKLDLQALAPVAAYVGSGLSYESGLPTLASVHEDFGVDRLGSGRVTFGSEDPP